MSRQIIRPARRVAGSIRVPGDKSISHRALLIAGVGEGLCRISGLSDSEDVAATEGALASLGVAIDQTNSQVEVQKLSTQRLDREVLVAGEGWAGLKAPSAPIYCQNSGTTARTLLGVLAGRPITAILEGDDSLSARPMRRVIDPLVRMGATIESAANRLPVSIRGGDLKGVDFASPIASAQVKTAVLLAGLQAEGSTSVGEPAQSRDHTERLLEYIGVHIEKTADRLVVKATNIRNASSLSIPGDLSSAAFLLVAAAILPSSEATVLDVGVNPTRTGILNVLRAYGADVQITDQRTEAGEPVATVTVRAGDRRGVDVAGAQIVATVDELPLVAVLAAFAEGETTIRDAAELRVKESDRIATVAEGLRALGADVRAMDDGMTIQGGRPLTGADVRSHGDHRIAMALAVAALGATGETVIDGWEAVGVSYPGFLEDLESIVER